MSSATYRTNAGDQLDWICWRHYGASRGTVEAVLSANPGLADRGHILPAGVLITLPEIAAPATQTLVRLWGSSSGAAQDRENGPATETFTVPASSLSIGAALINALIRNGTLTSNGGVLAIAADAALTFDWPTSAAGLRRGQVWNNGGLLCIVE